MTKTLASVLAVLLFVGCASESPTTKALTSCKQSDRHGSYLATWTTVSGNCGAIASSVVILDASAPLEPGCSIGYENWSNGDCTVDRKIKCATSEATGTSTQKTADGSVIDGTITISITGASACFGTYRVHYVRQ